MQGRVARYKKIKAFDPFSKTHGVTPDPDAGKSINLPPKASDIERLPNKLRDLLGGPRHIKPHKHGNRGGRLLHGYNGKQDNGRALVGYFYTN